MKMPQAGRVRPQVQVGRLRVFLTALLIDQGVPRGLDDHVVQLHLLPAGGGHLLLLARGDQVRMHLDRVDHGLDGVVEDELTLLVALIVVTAEEFEKVDRKHAVQSENDHDQ